MLSPTMNKKKKEIAEGEARSRLDMKVDPAFAARIRRQAKRKHLTITGYILMATSERLERDEATDPKTDE